MHARRKGTGSRFLGQVPPFTHAHTDRHAAPIYISPYTIVRQFLRVFHMDTAASVQGYREPKGRGWVPARGGDGGAVNFCQRSLPYPSFFWHSLNHVYWIIVHFNWMILEMGRDRFIGERNRVISSIPGWERGPRILYCPLQPLTFFFRHSLYHDYRIMIVLN